MSKQGAGSAEPGAERMAHNVAAAFLPACWGSQACVCRAGGTVARGPLTSLAPGEWRVQGVIFRASDVGSITVEPDLVTIHLGDIA